MNLDTIEQIVALISEHPVSEITLEQNGQKIHVRRGAAPFQPPPVSTAHTEFAETNSPTSEGIAIEDAAAEEEPGLLTAPMVGLFHHPAHPVSYGALVTPGQVVGAIESMKLINDVLADLGGRVVEVLVESGAPVEYGQPLFRLSPV